MPMKNTRWIVFVASVAVLLGLLSRYDSLPQAIAMRLSPSPEIELRNAIATLQGRNPEAAGILQSLTDSRRRRSVEAVLRSERARPGGDTVRSAERLAEGIEGEHDEVTLEEARYELALLSTEQDLAQSSEERTSFIVANATVLDAIDSIRSLPDGGAHVAGMATSSFLTDLRKVTSDPAAFRAVANDPIGIMLFDEVDDSEVRKFYLAANADSKHPDWLKAIIAETARASAHGTSPFRVASYSSDSIVEGDEDSLPSVGEVVRVAYENHPLFQQSFFDDMELAESDRRPAPVVVALFKEHGELIRLAAGPKGNVPRSEILDVLFANEDFLDRWKLEKGESTDSLVRLTAHLSDVQKSKPGVWREARYSPLALRLDVVAPSHSNDVLEKYGPDDIAALLLSGYETSAAKAAEAVSRFGDLAIVVLRMYADETGGEEGMVHRALLNPKVGIRVVPYVAKMGDEALSQLEEDSRWCDKYFDEEGRPRKDVEGYEAIPFVGAPAKVAANWTKGHPSTWEEIGWAAVDVADTALLVATFGASSAIAPAKEAGKQAAKTTAKAGAKAAVIRGGKALASDAARTSTREVAREARKQIGRSLLRGSAGLGLRVIGTTKRIAGGGMSAAWLALKWVLSSGYRTSIAVVSKANELRKFWGRVPQSVRRAVYGGLLAASMYLRVRDRTLPNSPLLGEELGSFAGSVVDAVGKTGATAFGAFVGEVAGLRDPVTVGWVAYGIACALAAAVAWRSRPWERRAMVYG